MSHIVEQVASSSDFAGIGNELIRLKDNKTGEVLAYIGNIGSEECVSFTRPVRLNDLISIIEIMQKKKFNKALSKNEIDKAEGFINKKFNQK